MSSLTQQFLAMMLGDVSWWPLYGLVKPDFGRGARRYRIAFGTPIGVDWCAMKGLSMLTTCQFSGKNLDPVCHVNWFTFFSSHVQCRPAT